MKIYLAADHAGFALKEALKKYLSGKGHEVVDMGASTLDPNDDYPDFMKPAAEALALSLSNGVDARGIFLGGSGQGEAMVANRVAGVRAAVLYNFDERAIKLSREHNDANVLCLGARFLTEPQTVAAVQLWLETPFSGEKRHVRRLAKF